MTKEKLKEAQAMIKDLDMIIANFNKLPDKCKSQGMKDACNEFIEQVVPQYKLIKAQLLVEMGAV